MCPAGHTSQATDYCDECGLPVAATSRHTEAPAQHHTPEPPRGQLCPNCHTASPPDALFCEACGYDFITGTMPRGTASELLGLASPARSSTAQVDTPPVGPAKEEKPSLAPDGAADEPVTNMEPHGISAQAEDTREESGVDSSPSSSREYPERGSGATGGFRTDPSRWVAEVWIDPDWYRLQESPDPLPSPGLPEIFPLPADGGLIGRFSRSQHIDPAVDCGSDSGCSRRHARLTGDGRRWWVEDLDSSNGTFVGTSGDPLPTSPIGQGKVELTIDSRIYVGAWTRIVVRPATDDETAVFA